MTTYQHFQKCLACWNRLNRLTYLSWSDTTTKFQEYLIAKGWQLDHGEWICPHHVVWRQVVKRNLLTVPMCRCGEEYCHNIHNSSDGHSFQEAVLYAVNDTTEKKIPPANARIDQARNIVWMYANEHLDKSDGVELDPNDVYVVWFCYILGGWKALVSTNLLDGMYYEVTFNYGKNQIYLDAYKKFDNRCYPQAVVSDQ